MNPKIVAILSFLYVICPIDLIPDFIPIIGWIDDLGAAGVGITAVAMEVKRYIDRQA